MDLAGISARTLPTSYLNADPTIPGPFFKTVLISCPTCTLQIRRSIIYCRTCRIWISPVSQIQEHSPSNQVAPSVNPNRITGYFYLLSLCLLLLGLAFGLLASLQYVFPGFIREYLSFERTRPLHVSPVIFWIIITAAGTVFNYLSQHIRHNIYSGKLLSVSLLLFGTTLLLILILYLNGIFGGREYWEFPPFLAIPIGLGWVL